MNIYYQNVRGLRTKTSDFYANLCVENYDIVCLTETWLNESVGDSEIFSDMYEVYRKDRVSSTKKWGGGVLIAIKNIYLGSERIFDLETDDSIWMRAELSDGGFLYVCSVYLSPNSSVSQYNMFFDKIETQFFREKDRIVIVGDFNLLVHGTDIPLEGYSDLKVKNLHQFLNYNGLCLCNNIKNKMGRTLDLVISNVNLLVDKADYPLSKVDEYHPPLVIICDKMKKVGSRRILGDKGMHYVFNKGDYVLLYEHLNQTDWGPLYELDDPDLAVNFLYDNLQHSMSLSIPRGFSPKGHKYPRWYSFALIKKIKLKSKYRSLAKRFGRSRYWNRYRKLRREIKNDSKICYKKYMFVIEKDLQSNPKKFWNFINERRGLKGESKVQFKINDNLSPTNLEIANGFATHFSSVFKSITNDKLSNESLEYFSDILIIKEITINEIELAIKKLKAKSSIGPDGIPAYIVKGCGALLLDPLCYIFNLSLRLGVFPQAWKLSKVTPIFKKGDKTHFDNYRPISIMSSLAKVFEHVIYNRVAFYFSRYVSEFQHGFITKRSVASNLVAYVEYLSQSMDEGFQVDSVYTDFSKAFDSVNHRILLDKLDAYGFSDNLLKFFSSYLSGRKQYVAYKGCKSNTFLVTRGVPQGSNLGPLLFLIFINDITNVIKNSRFLLYADDLKIFKCIRGDLDQEGVQKDLCSVDEWCAKNDLHLNIKKCHFIIFSRRMTNKIFNYKINGTPLTESKLVNDLGVVFDQKLNFNTHVEQIVSRAYKTLGLVRRTSYNFSEVSTMKTLYFSLVRPILEYVPIVWYPHTEIQISAIENIQKKFLRYLFYRSTGCYTYSVSYCQLLEMFAVGSLSSRRDSVVLNSLHKIVSGGIDSPELLSLLDIFVPSFNSRQRNLFYKKSSKTIHRAWSPVMTMMSLSNRSMNGGSFES